jgi:hypothetical protein
VNRKDRADSVAALAMVLLAGVALAGCGKQIGDDCQTAADCDPNGGRICDLSQPGGYCTVLGCDETTCPSEATCIRYFPAAFLTRPCNPYCEDRKGLADDGGAAGADAGIAMPPLCPARFPADAGTTSDVCPNGPTNDCSADEICLDSGLCAPRSTEVRYCAKVCSSNSDCRGGYVCRPTGTAGSFELSANTCAQTSFCSPL